MQKLVITIMLGEGTADGTLAALYNVARENGCVYPPKYDKNFNMSKVGMQLAIAQMLLGIANGTFKVSK